MDLGNENLTTTKLKYMHIHVNDSITIVHDILNRYCDKASMITLPQRRYNGLQVLLAQFAGLTHNRW